MVTIIIWACGKIEAFFKIDRVHEVEAKTNSDEDGDGHDKVLVENL